MGTAAGAAVGTVVPVLSRACVLKVRLFPLICFFSYLNICTASFLQPSYRLRRLSGWTGRKIKIVPREVIGKSETLSKLCVELGTVIAVSDSLSGSV